MILTRDTASGSRGAGRAGRRRRRGRSGRWRRWRRSYRRCSGSGRSRETLRIVRVRVCTGVAAENTIQYDPKASDLNHTSDIPNASRRAGPTTIVESMSLTRIESKWKTRRRTCLRTATTHRPARSRR